MPRLTSKDYRDVLDLVYLANGCPDTESFITALYPSLMRMFRAECATFQLVKVHEGQMEIVESRSFKADSHNLYEDEYYPVIYVKDSLYRRSPLLNRAISSWKIASRIGDSISFREWERSDFYNEFIRPQHLYWELFLALRWRNKLEGMVTLWRPRSEPDYGDNEFLKAATLASHLGVVVRNICLISRMNRQTGESPPLDEAAGEGLLWLDHRLRPSFFNREALYICRQLADHGTMNAPCLEEGELRIPPCIIEDCSRILDALKRREQPVMPPKERIVLAGSDKKFRIECSLMWKADAITSTPSFVVTLCDLSHERKVETALQTRFRLTRRELDIIHYLTRGLSDAEIGEKLYISRHTVHTHIKNIYKKLDVKSRIQLFRKVTESSYPGILDHRHE